MSLILQEESPCRAHAPRASSVAPWTCSVERIWKDAAEPCQFCFSW